MLFPDSNQLAACRLPLAAKKSGSNPAKAKNKCLLS
jgi:hypothetical protein